MIKIKTQEAFDNFKQAFDRLRPVIITKGDRHVITSKGNDFIVPLTIHQAISKGNVR
jgi:NAD(P)H-hydrate repair Nnr-like enzyme with NAD(P)H-hydrate dehydratase domain